MINVDTWNSLRCRNDRAEGKLRSKDQVMKEKSWGNGQKKKQKKLINGTIRSAIEKI